MYPVFFILGVIPPRRVPPEGPSPPIRIKVLVAGGLPQGISTPRLVKEHHFESRSYPTIGQLP
jgi:hypothetical protein